ncbi:MAG: sugar ABC transporter permease [Spirochaetales bacterium]|nr:sugar ABC transporter permease [Spirochaetales bacterium]
MYTSAPVEHRGEMGDRLFAFLLILPALLVIAFVILYPLANAVYTSFFRYFLTDGLGRRFIGLQNYRRMLESREFWTAFGNTIVYVGGTVALEFVVALPLALLVNTRFPLKNLVNSLFFVPWIIPSVVVAFIARFLFLDAHHGIVNVVLHGLGIIPKFLPWLKDPGLAMPTVIAVTTWKMMPFMFVILYAGLQAVPREEIEAATIDGATGAQRFRYVILPNLREIIVLATVLEFIWQFQYLTIIFTTTQGGPIDRTLTLPLLIYRVSFMGSLNMGYSSTIGVFWLVFLLGFSILYVRLVGRAEK